MLYDPFIPPIDEFQGRYRFLSNFYPVVVEYDGMTFGSVEHAYQAAKTYKHEQRIAIRECDKPGDAKRKGRQITLRPDWEKVKLGVMLDLLQKKFQYPVLEQLLLATGHAQLIEGNHWGDVFWGQCGGTGQNHLGKILMQVRQELQPK